MIVGLLNVRRESKKPPEAQQSLEWRSAEFCVSRLSFVRGCTKAILGALKDEGHCRRSGGLLRQSKELL